MTTIRTSSREAAGLRPVRQGLLAGTAPAALLGRIGLPLALALTLAPAAPVFAQEQSQGQRQSQSQSRSQDQGEGARPAVRPFDMGSERQDIDGRTSTDGSGMANGTGADDTDVPESAEARGEPADPRIKRYLVETADAPALSGELARQSFTLNVSEDQAESPATLNFGYQNAVVIAPESSTLTVFVNGERVAEEAIASSNAVMRRAVELPEGLLDAGDNTVTFAALQRHRTDCTLESTYELITEISPATTYLAFDRDVGGDTLALSDLATLGAGANGSRRITVVAPLIERADISADLVDLAQAIALSSDIDAPEFEVVARPEDARSEDNGRNPALTIYLGARDDIEPIAGTLPEDARGASSHAGFMTDADGHQALLVTGTSDGGWRAAIQTLARLARADTVSVDRPGFSGDGGSYTFAELGLETIQFAGRRFETSFTYDMPYDIYADAFGEAEILLDAAYADTIEAGSQLNVLVNGEVANSLNFSGRGGGVFEHQSLDVPMRNFRPGENEITLAVNLIADEDEICAPGANAEAQPRLAIFDSSEFSIERFARIDRRPNLAALTAGAHPYADAGTRDDDDDDTDDGDDTANSGPPVPVTGAPSERPAIDFVMMRGRQAPNDAAMTLAARLARSAGEPFDVTVTGLNETPRNPDAIVIGEIAAIPDGLLDAVGIDSEARNAWRAPETDEDAASRRGANRNDGPRTLAEWDAAIEERDFGDWIADTFNLSADTFSFGGRIGDYTPGGDDTLVLAQAETPDTVAPGGGDGTLTVVTAPSRDELARSTAAFVESGNWNQAGGRLTAFSRTEDSVETVAAERPRFVASQPLSLDNSRLIATNWLSGNVVTYVAALFIFCFVLGLITYAMLSAFGRRNDDA